MRISTVFWVHLWEFLEGRYTTPSLPSKIPLMWPSFWHHFSADKPCVKAFGSCSAIYIFSHLWVLRYGSLYRCISNVWSNVIELTKLKSKEADLPLLFKDTLSDCRWIEYCSGSVMCDLIRYIYSSLQARRPSGTCCWRHKCNNWIQG